MIFHKTELCFDISYVVHSSSVFAMFGFNIFFIFDINLIEEIEFLTNQTPSKVINLLESDYISSKSSDKKLIMFYY